MSKFFKYASILCFLTAGSAWAQSNYQLRSQIIEAESNKDWFSACQYYNRLYYNDSTNLKMRYGYATAARLSYDYDVALRLYNGLAAIDNGKRFPLTFYWIGQLLKSKQKYKEAKKWFTKFYKLDLKKGKYTYYKNKSKLEMEACDIAQIILNELGKVPPLEHLDATINTKQSEYGAFEKDSSLYFSSIRVPERKTAPQDVEEAMAEAAKIHYSKIFKSDVKNQKFKKIKQLDTLINSNYLNNANTSINAENNVMIVSRCRALNASDYQCDLYESRFENKKWQQAVKMPEPVNQMSVSTTQPNLTRIDGKEVLFFASDRPGGEGGLDIWYCYKNLADGSYDKPINAGNKVNSPDDDITPWYVEETKTLYFSSTYHKGYGGFDIFRSTFSNGQFSEPENLNLPINSSHNDVYYTVSKDGRRMYLSSNRVGSLFESKQNCCNDIFRYVVTDNVDTVKPTLPVVDTVKVMKEQMKLLVPLTLYFHNDEPDPKTKNTTTTKSYETTFTEYKALLPQYTKEYSAGLKGMEKEIAMNRITNFFNDSLEAGLDALNQFSNLLEKVLRNGETVKITLKGYCSPLASTEYNVILAKRRISSLRNYFATVKGGAFNKYVDNTKEGEGKIIFEQVDVGELPKSKVSDNFKDKQNSVYSPFAASERKIQILAVSFGK
ncbi:MAG: PD40 domain-containing protein [Bacteroidia bacterium]|nr:PD40 domain-containing protein [Bacteroidia bacterium]